MAEIKSSRSHGGRPKSWVTVAIMLAGFIVGGAGLTMGPSWVVFWVGAAMVAGGGLLALAFDIMTDVIVDDKPRIMSPQVLRTELTSKG